MLKVLCEVPRGSLLQSTSNVYIWVHRHLSIQFLGDRTEGMCVWACVCQLTHRCTHTHTHTHTHAHTHAPPHTHTHPPPHTHTQCGHININRVPRAYAELNVFMRIQFLSSINRRDSPAQRSRLATSQEMVIRPIYVSTYTSTHCIHSL